MINKHAEAPRLIPRPRRRLNQDWLTAREARRQVVWRELTQPSMGHGALEALREERVKREMERRVAFWLHRRGLSADPALTGAEAASTRTRKRA